MEPLEVGQRITNRFKKNPGCNEWTPSEFSEQYRPRSYVIQDENNNKYRRSRVHVKINQKEPDKEETEPKTNEKKPNVDNEARDAFSKCERPHQKETTTKREQKEIENYHIDLKFTFWKTHKTEK